MKLKYIVSTIILFIAAFTAITFYPKEKNAEEKAVPLMIEPIYPANQNPQTKGYFDLSVSQGTKQTLRVKLTNKNTKQVNVSMKAANAYTNPTGGIMYDPKLDSPDTSLLSDAILMTNYITLNSTITVPPLSSVEVPITVNIPPSKGQTALGGVLFITKGEGAAQEQAAEKGKAKFVVKTETVNAMAIQLNYPNEVPSKLLLGKAGFKNGTGQVSLELTNDAEKIEKDIKGNYAVFNKQGEELFEGDFGPFNMAPKSKIKFPIPWGAKKLSAGDYKLAVTGSAGAENKKLSTAQTFTIEKKDIDTYVKKTNPATPQVESAGGIPIWVWIAGVVLVGIIMFLLGRRRK